MQSKKSFFNATVFKKNIDRTWLLGFAALFIMFLMMGMDIFLKDMMVGYESYEYQIYKALGDTIENSWKIGFAVPAVFSLILFSYLQSARSVSFYHSLPISRKGLYITNVVSGLVIMYIPNILLYIAFIIKTSGVGFCPMDALTKWLIIICAEELLYFAVDVFCVILTGNILVSAGLNIIVTFLPQYIYKFLEKIIKAFTFGYAEVIEEEALKNYTFQYVFDRIEYDLTDSVDASGKVVVSCTIKNFTSTIIITSIVAVIILIAALLIYKTRKSEASGDYVAIGWFKPIALWGGSFAFSLFVSSILVEGFADEIIEKYTTGIIAFSIASLAVMGLIAYILLQLLVNKSLKIIKKIMRPALCFTAFMIVAGFGILGFSCYLKNYQPEKEDISCSGMTYDGKSINTYDAEMIGKLMEIQKKAINGQENWITYNSSKGTDSLTLRYVLKNGKEIIRRYGLSKVDGVGAEIEKFLEDNIIRLTYGNVDYNRLIISPNINFETEYGLGIEVYDKTASKRIYDALCEDAEAGRIDSYIAINGAPESAETAPDQMFYALGIKYQDGKVPDEMNAETYICNGKIYFTEKATATMAVFEQLIEEYGLR